MGTVESNTKEGRQVQSNSRNSGGSAAVPKDYKQNGPARGTLKKGSRLPLKQIDLAKLAAKFPATKRQLRQARGNDRARK